VQTKVTQQEAESYLKALAMDNEVVRFVDPERGVVQNLQGEDGGKCHDLWGRCNHCENCTSIRALRTKGKACKIEMLGGHTYWVTSRYLEIDGTPRISEAVQDVSGDLLADSDRDDKTTALLDGYKQMAITDSLTGVYNRRFLDENFIPSLACCEDPGLVVNIGFIDMDGFKGVNDRYGHVAGDQLLRDVAGFWKRRYDSRARGHERLVVRFGGDEILVIACGMHAAQFREEMARYDGEMVKICHLPDQQFPFDYSLGIASSEELGPSWKWDDLFDSADHRMYMDKKGPGPKKPENTLH
jgi:putative two-component system response regulator